jgi:hypothetical protein
MRKDGLKPSVVYVHRSRLPELFESVLGEENFKRTTFNRLVPRGDNYVSTKKAIPTWEQVSYMLKISTPQYRALIASLASIGWRIMEALTRKMSDLEIRPHGYARIKLQARETKAREFRYVFVTKEVVEMIKVYHLSTSSEWMFPGEKGNHLSYAGAEEQIKRTFEKAGLMDAEDGSEAYSPHSFRTVADSRMSKAGLDRKYIEMVIGHKGVLGASNSYRDWETVEQEWLAKCEKAQALAFSEHVEVVKEVVDTQARNQNKFLLELFGKMLTPEQRAQLDTMVAESGTFHEFKPGEYEELLKLPLEQRRKRLIEIQKTNKSDLEKVLPEQKTFEDKSGKGVQA